MASRRSSKTNGAHTKLLRMVNDQRARCKLTTLDDVMNHTGYSWVESMLEHARDLYQDHSTRVVSEADMNVNILRSPKKEKHKQKLTKKVTSSKKPSPYKKSRIPKESTPPRKSPKKLSVSSRNVSPSSSISTKVALRDSTSSRGTLVDKPLQAINLNKSLEIDSANEIKANPVPVVVIEQKVETVKTPILLGSETRNPKKIGVDVEEVQFQESRKRRSEVELEQATKKRHSQNTIESVSNENSAGPAKKESVILIDDTLEEEEVVAVTVDEKEDVAVIETAIVVSNQEHSEDSIALIEDEEKEDEDSIEVSRVVTEKIDFDSKMDDKVVEAGDTSLEKEEIQSVDSALMTQQSEPIKGVKDLKAVITQLRNSLDDTISSNDAKTVRSDDVFSEGEAEPIPSSSSGSSAPKPSLRERIDRFRAIFSPAPRPASSIPRLSPPKYMQSPPRPQLSSISKPIAKSIAIKPIEAKLMAKPVVAKAMERFEPKTAPKVADTVVEKLIEKPVTKAVEKPAEKTKEKVADKPIMKVAVKPTAQTSSIALASPPKSPAKKMFESALPVAPAPVKTSASSSSAHHVVTAPTTNSHTAKTVSVTSTLNLPMKVVAPVRGSSIQIAAPVPIRAPSQFKPAAAAPVKAVPSQPAPVMSLANHFQKAQQQQQQQVLATTSNLRTAKQAAVPVPSTAHIELEEPDSAYSDSEDEETVRRRQQHKPWETREGLAKALEEQATIDADMIFGIPHGAVPIDEILPPDTEHARAKRARPRSSSATWSRDGLKQIEIDRYNERMGIQGPGALLPITVQDDGSGTPSRSHRLSAIAQSAVSQGQVSRKPSYSAHRGSMSPIRPGSVQSTYSNNLLAPSTIKYPQLVAGTPNRTKSTIVNPASTQKAKVSKPATTTTVSSSKQTKTPTTKNPFQNGTSIIQTNSRLGVGTSKTTTAKK